MVKQMFVAPKDQGLSAQMLETELMILRRRCVCVCVCVCLCLCACVRACACVVCVRVVRVVRVVVGKECRVWGVALVTAQGQ